MRFITPIWHPAVCSISGFMCCCALGGVLKKEWTPKRTVQSLLVMLIDCMKYPDLKTICHGEHMEWPQNVAAAEAKARQWTEDFASGSTASLFLEVDRCGFCPLVFALAGRGVAPQAFGHLHKETISLILQQWALLYGPAPSMARRSSTPVRGYGPEIGPEIFTLGTAILDRVTGILTTL